MTTRAGPAWLERAARISAALLLVGAVVVVLAFAAAKLALVVIPTVLAIMFAAVLSPPARWLESRRVPSSLAALLVLVAVLGFLGGVGALIGPIVAEELSTVGPRIVAQSRELLREVVEKTPLSWGDLQKAMEAAKQRTSEMSGEIATGVVTGAQTMLEVLAALVLTFILTFFFVRDGRRIGEWFVARFPERRRGELRAVLGAGSGTLRGYLKGMTLIAAVDAAGIGAGLWIIGVPLVLPLTVLTFFASYFPVIGATTAGAVACFVALVEGGPRDALFTLAVVIGVQQLESNLLEPLVQGRTLTLHPAVILLSLGAGGLVAGIAGAFLAVPLTALVVNCVRESSRYRARHRVPGEPSRWRPEQPQV